VIDGCVVGRFAKFGWGGTTYLTGSVICLAMFFIYTAAPNHIRFAKVREPQLLAYILAHRID
jgi:hypothetical protein